MKRILSCLSTVVVGSLLVSFSNFAYALMPYPHGLYIEGNLGIPVLTNQTYPGKHKQATSALGWNVNFGYKFIPFLAAEFGVTAYKDLRNYDIIIKDNMNNQAGIARHYSADMAVKVIAPFPIGVEIFGKAGLAVINTYTSITNSTIAQNIGLVSGSHGAFGPYAGAGIDWFPIADMALVAQWAEAWGHHGPTGNAQLYSLGLQFYI